MKFFKYIGIAFVAVVVLLYVLLFTGFGNALLKPMLQSKIQEASGMDVKLQRFRLGMSDLALTLYITPQNSLSIEGEYSLFAQNFDLAYDVQFHDLAALQEVAKAPLSGEFKTEGTIRGDLDFVKIDGKSDVAESQTNYHVVLENFEPSAIEATVNHLAVEQLLKMSGQKALVGANLDMQLNFKSIKPHALDGKVKLQTTQGHFNRAVIKKELGITIPKTTFRMQADATLKGERIAYRYLFDSNLAKIATQGSVQPQPLALDLTYSLSVKELALLQPMTKTLLRGRVNAKGHVKGDKKKMRVTLQSDLAGSTSNATVTLEEFVPSSLIASVKHLQLQKMLYMLNQPKYTSGELTLQANIASLRSTALKGQIVTAIKGKLNDVYLTKEYKFAHPMPKTSYALHTKTALKGVNVDTTVKLDSTLGKVNMQRARFNTQKNVFESDFAATIPSLEKLFFVTDRHLRGGITATGKISQAKDLLLSAHSKIAGGVLKVKLKNDDLHLDLNDMRTKKVLWILHYPEIFDGGVFAQLDYNLKKQRGALKADFKDGLFVKNKVFDALKQFAHVNLYKEYFNGKATAKIEKEKIAAKYALHSRKASIVSDKTLLDTKQSTIDAKIRLNVEKTPVDVTLKGNIAKPMVGVDLKAFMKSEAGKKLEKKATHEINKLFKKLF